MKWLVIVTSLVLVTLGQTNPAVRFDGDVNNAAFFSNGPWPELALTVEFWAATNQSTFGSFMTALSTEGENQLSFTSPELPTVAVLGDESKNFEPSVPTGDGTWHHFAVSWQSADGSIIMYLDGDREASFSGPRSVMFGTAALALGHAQNVPGDFILEGAYDGLLDDFRVWSVVRTRSQIRSTKDRKLSGSERGLLLYYSFDEFAQAGLIRNGASATGTRGDLLATGSLTFGEGPVLGPPTEPGVFESSFVLIGGAVVTFMVLVVFLVACFDVKKTKSTRNTSFYREKVAEEKLKEASRKLGHKHATQNAKSGRPPSGGSKRGGGGGSRRSGAPKQERAGLLGFDSGATEESKDYDTKERKALGMFVSSQTDASVESNDSEAYTPGQYMSDD